jgi:hypothetical protein
MPRTIAFDWEDEYLAGVEADVSGATVHVRRCFRYAWPEETDPPRDAASLGRWLAESLKQEGISPGEARVVLPREAVVVRKLDLPRVPESELPDLVRFQAATKSSTPLDRLALDFLPLPVNEGDETLHVLMVTVDIDRLQRVRDTLAAAGMELKGVGVSPVAVGELVTRMRGEYSREPNQATLVIFQDARRVEITALVQQRVIFSHQTRLSGAADEAGLRASSAEVNRTVIALSQAQSDLEIAEVCLIHAGDADPAFEQSLSKRFGERLHVLDVGQAAGIRLGRPSDARGLASFAPALGALLGEGERRVEAVDFLTPRRAVVPPDRTKLRIGIGAAAAALVLGGGYWMFSSHLAGLASETADIEARVLELDNELKAGEPELNKASLIGEWVSKHYDPLEVVDRMNRIAPGTDRLYLLSLVTSPGGRIASLGVRGATAGGRDAVYSVSVTGHAIEQADIQQLQEVLETAGFRVEPSVEIRSSDPDYPVGFTLNVAMPPDGESG